ncbi:MAG TPA: hypothetical protein VHX37_06830 [Acidobacteriaceae bacterium]|jgi:hypothetical protein|nr:hypothetical protein [Acidobacteriaceae bacterium]
MTIQVEVSPDIEARLIAAAQARGVAPAKYAEILLHDALASSAGGSGKLTLEQFHTMLREIAEGSEKLPQLPTSAFSRESFYEGRL